MTLLELRDIEKSFGGLRVLEGVSMTVEEGSIQGLIGPNGAGKTTLFNLVSGLLRADTGTIVFDGTDITDRAPKHIARDGVGRTFQLTRPYPGMTTQDNLLPGLVYAGGYDRVSTARSRALELLDLVDLVDLAHEESRDLTMSEQKRLEIARALATEPKLLLLDEVFAGLSHEDVARQIELIEGIRAELDVTILLIEHVMEATMTVCDRVGVLANGTIIAEDVPDEIVHDEQVIDVYLGSGRGEAGTGPDSDATPDEDVPETGGGLDG
ncbi:ABC transporter-like protein [Halovivax asiaticus JCM 14624]|uniref:ABC transporter-like protein n=1 Tax=Halovivax asiaticus JCM 14624 TaxID=1227490 RepID=M0BFZ6_9EURY|nr:ABC transporter ATP-binding protein [Halovivax asiaticus]ELZ09223.1 ABC transporter-like protein [Halovivax asiaticus JCM 14624]